MKLLLLFLFSAIAALAQPATAITVNQTRANGGTSGNCLKVNTNGTVGQTSGCGGGGGAGTVTSVSGSGPSWLTWNITNPTTTPAVALAPTTGQTSHRVIGTCGTATTFAPCALVTGDLPAGTGTVTSVSGTANQIGVATGTTTAVVSIVNDAVIPGNPTTTTQATGDSSTKISTDAYVANALASINPAVSVEAATVGVLSNTPTYSNGTAGVGATLTAGSVGVLTVDGYSPAINEPILVKNQASAFQNGIYTLTTVGTGGVAYILTRRTDYNTPTNINYTGTIPVLNGSTLNGTGWNLTTQVNAIGTDALTYTQAAAGSSSGPPGGNVKGFGNLTNNAVVIGQNGKTIATIGVDNTATHVLVANASGPPSFQALPSPGASTLGGIESLDCTGTPGSFISKISTSGVPTCTAPSPMTNCSGATAGWTCSLFVDAAETCVSLTFVQCTTTADSVTFTLAATTNVDIKYIATGATNRLNQILYNAPNIDGSTATITAQAIVFTSATLVVPSVMVYRTSLAAGAHTVVIFHKISDSGTSGNASVEGRLTEISVVGP